MCVGVFMHNAKCDKCGAVGLVEVHHRLSQSKINKKLYGSLIHHTKNCQVLCQNCHHNKPLDKWDEETFCREIGIEPRSKCAQNKRLRTK